MTPASLSNSSLPLSAALSTSSTASSLHGRNSDSMTGWNHSETSEKLRRPYVTRESVGEWTEEVGVGLAVRAETKRSVVERMSVSSSWK